MLPWTIRGVEGVSYFSWCTAMVDLVTVLVTTGKKIREHGISSGYDLSMSSSSVTISGVKAFVWLRNITFLVLN